MKSIDDIVLSVIIPCYNEKDTIEEIVGLVNDSKVGHKEIIIVDDCSTDGTREILKDAVAKRVSKILYHERNQGKGAAIRTGIAAATGDIVIIQDADKEYDPQEYRTVLMPFVENQADIVYGSRFTKGNLRRVVHYWHRVGNSFLTKMSNMFTDLDLTDMETCYKAFKREIIQSITIEENRFGFEPEITAKIARGNYSIYEVGISYRERGYGEGKKIGMKDGFRALWCIIKYNLRGSKN
jgi:glycosyltransferase involved in cell wall biosynthesis